MTGLDAAWAQEQLAEFLRLWNQVAYEQTPSSSRHAVAAGSRRSRALRADP